MNEGIIDVIQQRDKSSLCNQQAIEIEETVTNTNPDDETTRNGAIGDDKQQTEYADIWKTMERKAKYLSHLHFADDILRCANAPPKPQQMLQDQNMNKSKTKMMMADDI